MPCCPVCWWQMNGAGSPLIGRPYGFQPRLAFNAHNTRCRCQWDTAYRWWSSSPSSTGFSLSPRSLFEQTEFRGMETTFRDGQPQGTVSYHVWPVRQLAPDFESNGTLTDGIKLPSKSRTSILLHCCGPIPDRRKALHGRSSNAICFDM